MRSVGVEVKVKTKLIWSRRGVGVSLERNGELRGAEGVLGSWLGSGVMVGVRKRV